MRALLVALAVVAGAVAAGCGGDAPSPAPGAAAGGEYAGRSGGGVGASIDFAGFDPTARALRRVLGAEGVSIGIASMVNESSAPVPVPRFVALDARGEPRALTTARDALDGRAGAAAARALLPPERRTLAAGGTAVRYLVLRGSPSGEVVLVRMRLRAGETVELRPRM